LYISGPSNDPFFGDGLYAMPDAMDTDMVEVHSDAIQAIAGCAVQGDAMDDNGIFTHAFGADPFDGEAFDGDAFDRDAFEDALLDGEALETTSQGKIMPSPRSFTPHITNN